MSIPPDWTPTQSTRAWALQTDQTDRLTTAADGFRPPSRTVYVSAFAATLAPGTPSADWIAEYQGMDATGHLNMCAPEPVDLGMPTVDGHPVTFTRAVPSCGETQAFVPVGDKEYVFSVWIDGQEDLLKTLLSTVRFRPWTTYTSDRYDFTIGRPADWSDDRSDHVWTFEADGKDPVSTGYESFVNPEGHVRVSAWTVPRDPAEGEMWANTSVESWRNVEPWVKAYCERTGNTPCTGIHERAVPLCLEKRDCHPGLLVAFQDDIEAFFTNGGEGAPMTIVAVWRGPTDPNTAQYGGSRALLEAFLSTMGVQPAEASPFAESRADAASYRASAP